MNLPDETPPRGPFLSSIVREFATERGVSDRTAWRLLARLKAEGSLPAIGRPCEECETLLPKRATIRRRYCGPRCRMRARRRRQRQEGT